MIFLDIVKIPSEVEVMKIKTAMSLPSSVGSEKIRTIIMRIDSIIMDSLL